MFRDIFSSSLAKRQMEPEVMDDPDLEDERHHRALDGLATVNSLSLAVSHLWKPIERLVRETNRTEPLKVLDIATGGGDIPIGIWKRAQAAKIPIEITGVDISQRALDFAQKRADKAGAEVTFTKRDIVADGLPDHFDVLTASLFLHHLEDEQAVWLLREMNHAAREMMLISDLCRGRTHLALAHIAAWLFTSSDVVRIDGPLSVKAAFNMAEVRKMVDEAGMANVTITAKWPFRFLLEWRR